MNKYIKTTNYKEINAEQQKIKNYPSYELYY